MNNQNYTQKEISSSILEKPKLPILASIFSLFLLIDGVFNVLGAFPVFIIGGIMGILVGIIGIGKIVVAIGLRKSKKWSLYGLTVFVVIGIVLFLINKIDITATLLIVIEIIVLIYFWSISKKFK